jgi:hypothetical protein
MNVTTLLRRQFVFWKLSVLHENFLLSHTPMSSNVRISLLGNHLKGSQNSVLLWRSIQILYRISTLNIWKSPCVCVCVCLCVCVCETFLLFFNIHVIVRCFEITHMV